MKKHILILVLLFVICTGIVSAQGYIKATYSMGFLSASNESIRESGMGMSFVVDFIDSSGITLGVKFLSTFIDGFTLIPFGMGYTYDKDNWSVGVKFMGVPRWWISSSGIMPTDEICPWNGFGFDLGGTYWFTQGIGISGIFDLFLMNDLEITVIAAGIGLSIKQ